jgi:hypothetical protein
MTPGLNWQRKALGVWLLLSVVWMAFFVWLRVYGCENATQSLPFQSACSLNLAGDGGLVASYLVKWGILIHADWAVHLFGPPLVALGLGAIVSWLVNDLGVAMRSD